LTPSPISFPSIRRNGENHGQYVFQSGQGTIWNGNWFPCRPNLSENSSGRRSPYVVIIRSKFSSDPRPERVRQIYFGFCVVSASTCFPDADPTMTPRDRPLLSQVRADVPNKKPKMSATPPDKRFAYWDCAPALPTAQGRPPRFWLGSILRRPQ